MVVDEDGHVGGIYIRILTSLPSLSRERWRVQSTAAECEVSIPDLGEDAKFVFRFRSPPDTKIVACGG